MSYNAASQHVVKLDSLEDNQDQAAGNAASNSSSAWVWTQSAATSGPSSLSWLPTNSNSGGNGLGQLQLLDDDGFLSAAQSNSASGSASSGGLKTVAAAPPAPTLVGAAGGLQFNLIWDSSVGAAPSAFQSAVVAAAKYYTTIYSNAEVINVNVGFGRIAGQAMAAGALGESMSYGYNLPYSTVAAALKKGASASNYSGYVNYVATADNSLSSTDPTRGGKFFTTTAETKALGLVAGGTPSTTVIDGYIALTNAYPLEYNQTASSGTYDAIGIAEHEFAEVMGRVGSEGSLFGANEYTPLDLFRYTSPGVRDLTPGPGYFSINGGVTNLGTYNNPKNGGDAADWISTLVGDSYGFGYSGHTGVVSPTDILETATLGYHLTKAGAAATQHLGLA